MEASPEYTEAGRAGEIAGRIAATLGRDLRLIYMVRDPLERIASAYVQEVANGRPVLPFSAAIRGWALEQGSRYGAFKVKDHPQKRFGRTHHIPGDGQSCGNEKRFNRP